MTNEQTTADSAEKRAQESQRPKYVRYTGSTSIQDGLTNNAVYQVVSWCGPNPIIKDDAVEEHELDAGLWEPAPAPVEQEPLESEYRVCWVDFRRDQDGQWAAFGRTADTFKAGHTPMIERRAYDKAMARVAELERELDAEKRLHGGTIEKLKNVTQKLINAETELTESHRVNGILRDQLTDNAKPAAFQVATIGPNSPQEIYGEVKAAPKVEPLKEYARKWYLAGLCFGDSFVSAGVEEFESKFSAELTKGAK